MSALPSEYIARSEPVLTDSMLPLWARLREAIAWCRAHAVSDVPATSLRTESTRPPLLCRDRFDTVGAVASCRRFQNVPSLAPGDLQGGRIVVFFPDYDLACGAAEHASRGFFDANNTPPWDTWVAMIAERGQHERNTYLLSWVPPEFLVLVQRGIDVNPEQCISWIEDTEVVIRELLETKAS